MQQTPNEVVHVWYQAAVVQDISSFYNTSSLDNYSCDYNFAEVFFCLNQAQPR